MGVEEIPQYDPETMEQHIRRGQHIGGVPVLDKIDHCLSDIQENGFREGTDWETKVAESTTVEELVGALVHAEVELRCER